MSDALAHLPMLPEALISLTGGSFVVGKATTEDAFMEIVWRLRRWNLYGNVRLKYSIDPFDEYDVLVDGGPNYIQNGEDNVALTSPFSSIDDILCNWRKTRSYADAVVIDEGTGESSPTFDIWWGPRAFYNAGGGTLDSFLLIAKKPNGDEEFWLTSDPTYDAGFRESDAFLTLDPDGANATVPLYETDSDRFGFIGEFVLKPGASYWPWVIDGDDTYDITTGEELENPLRNDSNGYPLSYFAQQA